MTASDEKSNISETEQKTSLEPQGQDEPKETAEAEAETPAEPDPLIKLEEENTELKDKVLRLTAEMENLRRRTEREKQDMAKYAITNFARDVLSIDDNLSRALQSVPQDAIETDPALKALFDGVEMTGRELVNVFERYGITRVDPKGEIFDPNCHQAMFEMPNPEVPAGTIIEVVATGYMIEDRVLRPAMVGIAKGGEKPKKADAEENTADKETPPQTGETVDKTA